MRSSRNVVYDSDGAHFSDAQLLVLASLWLRSAVLPGIGFIVMMVLSILMVGIYPAIIQQVSVKPNASDKEAPYILRNIDATRDGYGIETRSGDSGTVDYKSYPVDSNPSASDLGCFCAPASNRLDPASG